MFGFIYNPLVFLLVMYYNFIWEILGDLIFFRFLFFEFLVSSGLLDFFCGFYSNFFLESYFNKISWFFFKKFRGGGGYSVEKWVFEGQLSWCPNLGEEGFNFFLIRSFRGLFLLKTRDKLDFKKGNNLAIFIRRPGFIRLRVGVKFINADFFNKLEYYCLDGVPKFSLIGLGVGDFELLIRENLFFYLGCEFNKPFFLHRFVKAGTGEIFLLVRKDSLFFLNKNSVYYETHGVFIFESRGNRKLLLVSSFMIWVSFFGSEENYRGFLIYFFFILLC